MDRNGACPGCLKCTWTHHGHRHRWKKGQTIGDTQHGPAKYLPAFDLAAIRQIETTTVATAPVRTDAPPQRTRYLRDVGTVIGWDQAREATFSYAECSGSLTSRVFHGRPCHADNHRFKQLIDILEDAP